MVELGSDSAACCSHRCIRYDEAALAFKSLAVTSLPRVQDRDIKIPQYITEIFQLLSPRLKELYKTAEKHSFSAELKLFTQKHPLLSVRQSLRQTYQGFPSRHIRYARPAMGLASVRRVSSIV
jgi:hypothetical protein